MTLPPRALGARVRDPHVQWMGPDCVLLLGDVGARAVYLVETPTSFGRGSGESSNVELRWRRGTVMSSTVQRAAEKALTERYEALLRVSQNLISIRSSDIKKLWTFFYRIRGQVIFVNCKMSLSVPSLYAKQKISPWTRVGFLGSLFPLSQKAHLSSLTLAAREKETIEAALRESRGQVSGPSGAAAKLGIHRSTLESKITSLKIDKYRFKTASASKNS